jgi:hypothetical protein
MGASAAAAVILIKQKHIVTAFRQAGATSSTTAVAPAALGVHERLAFSKLRRRGVLRETGPGFFYLDEPAWVALRRSRHRRILILCVGLLVLAIVSTVFSLRAR